MADRPIIFSAPMVRALLDGRKTQTRRLLKPQPYDFVTDGKRYWNASGCVGGRICINDRDLLDLHRKPTAGDRAYVREHWKTSLGNDGVAPRDFDPTTPVVYIADGAEHGRYPVGEAGKHRQGRHMPRWASRLTLFVEDVRVQRLQDISEDDAVAEGIEARGMGPLWGWIDYLETNPNLTRHFADPRRSYASLWDSLHPEPGTRWDDNPWIYALTFRVARGNIDQLAAQYG